MTANTTTGVQRMGDAKHRDDAQKIERQDTCPRTNVPFENKPPGAQRAKYTPQVPQSYVCAHV